MQYSASFPYPIYKDFRDQAKGFSEIFAYFPLYETTIITRGAASTAETLMISGNFFKGYGSRLQLGRTIAPEDDQIGSEPVSVITYRLWERNYALDPNVLGQSIQINKKSFTIIGVLAKEFIGLRPGDSTDVYVPLSSQPQLSPGFPLESTNQFHWWVEIMGRLAPGANENQVKTSLAVFFRQRLAESNSKMDQPGILLEDGSRGPLMQRKYMAQPFWALLAIVGVVLLIACANLASLLLVRGAARQHEMSIRAAIGAERWRLIRQSLTESLLISLIGAACGLILAEWGKTFLLGSFAPFMDNLHFDTKTDSTVLWFTIGLTLLTSVLSGLLPALRASNADPAAGLKDRSALRSPRLWMGKALISTQIALSILLVMGAGLLIQTFSNLRHLDPGFKPENLLLFRLNAEQGGYNELQRLNFFENTRQSISAIPGVESVALSDLALISGAMSATSITIPDHPENSKKSMQTNQLVISEGFFSTMGMKLTAGRDFNLQDNKDSLKVIIVNETFAHNYLPGLNPIGQTINTGNTNYQIVGVCKDSKYQSLREEIPPTTYFTFRQWQVSGMYFEVRSTLPPLSLIPAVRKVVSSLDATIPIVNIKTQRQVLDQSLFQEQLFTSLCSFLALLALGLSCIGLYGLMAYTVTRRTSEIGIRMAIGARPRDVAFPIIREAILIASIGVLIGIPITLAVSHLIRSALYGIQSYDPMTLIAVSLLFVSVAIFAAWLPARRAARVDPMTALRCE